MAVARLTLAGFAQHRTRLALTIVAMALSVSLVVAVTTGYSSARAAIFHYLVQYMGSTDVEITRTGEYHEGMPDSVLAAVRTDPDVNTAVGRLETETNLLNGNGQDVAIRWVAVRGVQLPEDVEVNTLGMEPGTGGQWFPGSAGNVVVIDQEVHRRLNIKIGDELRIPNPHGEPLKLKVVGVVHKPQIMALAQQTIYVPLGTLQQFLNTPNRLTRVLVDLKPGRDEDAFIARWEERLKQSYPYLKVKTAREIRKEMDKNLQNVQFLSYLGGTISMLAATFIIFSTLSMGVSERQRNLAMLRAIGALRWQIGAVVVLEGLVLSVSGAAAGLPMGLLWAKLLALWRSDVFIVGVVPSMGGMTYGVAGSVLAALAASFLPAWKAMRLSPLEGITSVGSTPSRHVPLWSALVGLPLLLIDPALMYIDAVPQSLRFYGHFFLGIPALMVGFFLLSPVVVVGLEKTAGRAIAWVLGLRYELLAQQLSQSVWRAAGTAAALMVGLAILVVMHTQGNTLLKGWRLPDRFPDMFIFSALGYTPDQMNQLADVEGIKKNELIPFGIAISGLGGGFFSIASAAVLPDATMFIGIEPEKTLRLMELEFVEGNPQDAVRMLEKGRHLIVTQEFKNLKGLGIGDTLMLKTPNSGEVPYTIAGVVWSPGIDVFVSMFDMNRQFDQRSAATVFGSMDDARKDFGVERVRLFAANLEYATEREQLVERIKKKLGAWGIYAGDVRHIKAAIQQMFQKVLWLLSTVAMAAILVASLGVTNTVMASIRSRRWQFGILRSLGLTRGQLLRLILAEAVLLGLVGCVMGVAAGLFMSVNANAFGGRLVGYAPPIDVPWHVVFLGAGIIVAVALLASLWPALTASRQEPLNLLQEGRAAA